MLEPIPPSLDPTPPNPPLASASVLAPPRGLLGALGFEFTLTCSCEISSLTNDDLKQLTLELRAWLAREAETAAYNWYVRPAGFDHPDTYTAEWSGAYRAAQAADRARVLARVKPHESEPTE